MRRFAAVMNHRSAGFKANAMGVWAVPDDRARRDRSADGRLRGRVALLPAPDVRRLAVQRVHDGARPQRARLRSDDRGDPRPRPASTSTACCGRSRSTRRCASSTSRPSGTRGTRSTLRTVASRDAERPASAPPRRRVSHQVPSADAGRDARRRRRATARGCGRSRGVASRSASSFECRGFQPAAFRRSFATTHGCTRYGNTDGRRVAETGRPASRRAHASASSSGSAGRRRPGSSAPASS